MCRHGRIITSHAGHYLQVSFALVVERDVAQQAEKMLRKLEKKPSIKQPQQSTEQDKVYDQLQALSFQWCSGQVQRQQEVVLTLVRTHRTRIY